MHITYRWYSPHIPADTQFADSIKPLTEHQLRPSAECKAKIKTNHTQKNHNGTGYALRLNTHTQSRHDATPAAVGTSWLPLNRRADQNNICRNRASRVNLQYLIIQMYRRGSMAKFNTAKINSSSAYGELPFGLGSIETRFNYCAREKSSLALL